MKLITDWGFSAESWKGQRGEYWVLMQGFLLLGYVLLPIYHPAWLIIETPWLYGVWLLAGILSAIATVFLVKGLIDLGRNLTPLPYPKADGELIQSGIYRIIRHPLYSGIILAAKAYAIAQLSLSHLLATFVLFLFFNFKADREENWLSEKFATYTEYRQQVKKLIPWVF